MTADRDFVEFLAQYEHFVADIPSVAHALAQGRPVAPSSGDGTPCGWTLLSDRDRVVVTAGSRRGSSARLPGRGPGPCLDELRAAWRDMTGRDPLA